MKHRMTNLPQAITNLPLHLDRKEGKGVIGNGLVGWWLMDDNAANTAVTDHSPHHNHGTFNDAGGDPNTNAHSVIGKIGRALSFEGIDDFIDCGNDASLNITDAITIEAWIKTLDNTLAFQGIVSKRHAVDGIQYGCRVQFQKLKFNMQNMAGGGLETGDVISNNTWYLVSMTYDKQKVKIYLNGEHIETRAETVAFTPNTASVKIGRRSDDPSQYFNGIIDDVRIYNRALNQTEIKERGGFV